MRNIQYAGHLAGLVAVAIGTGLVPCLPSALSAQTTARPTARAQTVPVPHDDDAADDPALWIHPREPALSLILATNKAGGLHTYNMDGSEHQVVSDGVQPNNVDVLYDFRVDGRTRDLALATVRADNARGVKLWMIDAATRQLSDVTAGGTIPVFGGSEPYGACGYRSARTGRFYVFVTGKDGEVEQHELKDAGRGRVSATKVRVFELGSVVEGCVADHELGALYIAEEDAGVWRFDAEPDAPGKGKLVARVGENGLRADVEGVALYDAGGGRGYLIVSSQGNGTFKVYERGGENRYVLTIDPMGGRIGDVSETDGIVVTNCATSRQFARGLFVAQDGDNEGGNQNFKLYAWEDIAGTTLAIDTTCRVRFAGR
jgi:3-phytase